MVRFALVVTVPSIGPVARGDKEDTQLQVEAYTLPPLIRMLDPDPVHLRLPQEAPSRAEAALLPSGLQTSSQKDFRFPPTPRPAALGPSLTSF